MICSIEIRRYNQQQCGLDGYWYYRFLC